MLLAHGVKVHSRGVTVFVDASAVVAGGGMTGTTDDVTDVTAKGRQR